MNKSTRTIIGCIPVGGQGTRLGLPFSKEMLPQPSYSTYNPISNFTVQRMLHAGADKIVFVHGVEYKTDILKFYQDDKFVHVLQTPDSQGFAQTLCNAIDYMPTAAKLLFGLPDSYYYGYDEEPFAQIVGGDNSVAGLFTTTDVTLRVDRLTLNNTFSVKEAKLDYNTDLFWGICMIVQSDFDIVKHHCGHCTEIGDIFNLINIGKSELNAAYIDTGTWTGFNQWLRTVC